MTSLPIPFVAAFLLVLLVFAYLPRFKETASGRVFALVLCVNAFSMVLIGIRWSMDMVRVLPVVATLSVISTALLYLAFCSLGRRGPVLRFARDWLHLLPVFMVAISAQFTFLWLDIFLIGTKLVYAMLFVRLALNSSALQLVRLSWLSNTTRALWATVALLLTGIVLDVLITLDFALFEGQHAESMVGFVSLITLLILGWIVVQAARGRTQDTVADTQSNAPEYSDDAVNTAAIGREPETSEADLAALMERLDHLLVEQRLYADSELNLQRLARKAGVPSRLISRAINSQMGQNMSQWVNHARIDAVCELLRDREKTISEAMLESGFLTKSNFNREFRRIKGCSPSEWREGE